MMRRLLSRLRRSTGGATIVEFGLITPVMLLMLMGLMEVCYESYVQSTLNGAIRKAGRDAGIQGGQQNWTTIDQTVLTQVQRVAGSASIVNSVHQSYSSFSKVQVPEPYTDSNNNGKYDAATECFTDVNGNQTWDSDQGVGGQQGGASDVAVYTLTIKYLRPFPLVKLAGLSTYANMTAQTILRNQPYTAQSTTSPKTCCPGSGCN